MAVLVFVLAVVSGSGSWSDGADRRAEPTVRLIRSIPLPGVEGRIDHLAMDEARGRLLVAALGNDSVEVLDLAHAGAPRHLTGFHEPQGLAVDADTARVIVANGGNGVATMLDASDYRIVKEVRLPSDADNVRIDRANRLAIVGAGSGALVALDPRSGARIHEAPLAGHPESFQLTGDGRILVNVPDARQVAVVDQRTWAVTATWPVRDAAANFPMAIDPASRRVFIGCRRPARLLSLDLDRGRVVASADIDGDTDDLFFDQPSGRLFVICGAGFVDVLETRGGALAVVARVPTAPGARTGLLSPARRTLYVAVPHRGAQAAGILEMRIEE